MLGDMLSARCVREYNSMFCDYDRYVVASLVDFFVRCACNNFVCFFTVVVIRVLLCFVNKTCERFIVSSHNWMVHRLVEVISTENMFSGSSGLESLLHVQFWTKCWERNVLTHPVVPTFHSQHLSLHYRSIWRPSPQPLSSLNGGGCTPTPN